MFKLIKEKIEASLIEKIESYSSLNKNAFLMYKLCEKQPELAINAEGRAASAELFKLVLSKAEDKEKAARELLSNYEFSSKPECIKLALELNGDFIRYAEGKSLTFENFLMAINHPDETKRYEIPEDFDQVHLNFWETPKSEVKKFVGYDGRFLRLIDEEDVTKELIEIAFNNPDPLKRPNPQKLYNIRSNPKLVKELIKIDALY